MDLGCRPPPSRFPGARVGSTLARGGASGSAKTRRGPGIRKKLPRSQVFVWGIFGVGLLVKTEEQEKCGPCIIMSVFLRNRALLQPYLMGIYGHHYRRPSLEQEKDCPLKHVRVNLETSFSPRKPRPKPKQSVIRRLLRGAYGSGFRA